jgi:hypothetical protein
VPAPAGAAGTRELTSCEQELSIHAAHQAWAWLRGAEGRNTRRTRTRGLLTALEAEAPAAAPALGLTGLLRIVVLTAGACYMYAVRCAALNSPGCDNSARTLATALPWLLRQPLPQSTHTWPVT